MSLLILGVGAGRSLRRGEPWTLADHVTTTRLGLILVFCATTLSDMAAPASRINIAQNHRSCPGHIAADRGITTRTDAYMDWHRLRGVGTGFVGRFICP